MNIFFKNYILYISFLININCLGSYIVPEPLDPEWSDNSNDIEMQIIGENNIIGDDNLYIVKNKCCTMDVHCKICFFTSIDKFERHLISLNKNKRGAVNLIEKPSNKVKKFYNGYLPCVIWVINSSPYDITFRRDTFLSGSYFKNNQFTKFPKKSSGFWDLSGSKVYIFDLVAGGAFTFLSFYGASISKTSLLGTLGLFGVNVMLALIGDKNFSSIKAMHEKRHLSVKEEVDRRCKEAYIIPPGGIAIVLGLMQKEMFETFNRNFDTMALVGIERFFPESDEWESQV